MKILEGIGLLSAVTAAVLSCSSDQNPLAYQSDTHSRGRAEILIEESFKPLFDTSIFTFESQYPKADLVPEYLTEDEIVKRFFDRKAETIVISRQFTEEEEKYLKSRQMQARADKIAIDAIAIIVHPENKDTLMTVDQLRSILTGEVKEWPGNKRPVRIVYDQVNSANYNYLKTFCGKENQGDNVFAQKSNEQVIKYVKENPEALGVIGLNWISDRDDSNVLDFLEGIKVVGLAEKEGDDYFQPYSGFMYTREYPLLREIWMINKGRRSGLHTGFVIFMIGEIGQTIVQKASLLPARAPVRLIQFKAE